MIIPNGEKLFRFAKPEAFPVGQIELPSSIFNDPSLSCDWEKYRKDPTTSFHLNQGKTTIICIVVTDEIKFPENPKRSGQKVEAWNQKIVHDPILDGSNDAHSLIEGPKKQAVIDAIRKSSSFYKS